MTNVTAQDESLSLSASSTPDTAGAGNNGSVTAVTTGYAIPNAGRLLSVTMYKVNQDGSTGPQVPGGGTSAVSGNYNISTTFDNLAPGNYIIYATVFVRTAGGGSTFISEGSATVTVGPNGTGPGGGG